MEFITQDRIEELRRLFETAIKEYIYAKYSVPTSVNVYLKWTHLYPTELSILITPIGITGICDNSIGLNKMININELEMWYSRGFKNITDELDPYLIQAFSYLISNKGSSFISAVNDLKVSSNKELSITFIDMYRKIKEIGNSHKDALHLSDEIYKLLEKNNGVKTFKW